MSEVAKMKPLIYGTRSIIAWRQGAKTQTRRLVNPQPDEPSWKLRELHGGWGYLQPGWPPSSPPKRVYWLAKVRQPYAVGDLLWIREGLMKYIHTRYKTSYVIYQADHTLAPPKGLMREWEWQRDKLPAMFMPRWACRYYAKVLCVRPERLQDISDEDALAEGALVGNELRHHYDAQYHGWYFQWWDELHKKPGTRSEDNPWVWVYGLEAADDRSE